MIAIDFSRAKGSLRSAIRQFRGRLLQKRRFGPTSRSTRQGEQALPRGMILGSRIGRLVQIRARIACAGPRDRRLVVTAWPGNMLSYECRRELDSGLAYAAPG